MSMKTEFLYEDRHGDQQEATFTSKSAADYFREICIDEHPNRELLVETHDYRGGEPDGAKGM